MILQNTTLCTIVREEEANPAGGIADFIERTIPYVEEAVIVDTGSKLDKTKEILEEAKKRHPNLRVFHTTFKGFDHARNVSLDHATTNWVICLDADERIKSEDFATLADYHQARTINPKLLGYNIPIMNVFPDGQTAVGSGFNPKVFDSSKGVRFHGRVWENPSIGRTPIDLEAYDIAPVKIWHFVPDYDVTRMKKSALYKESRLAVLREKLGFSPSPLSFPNANQWRAVNAHREAYK